MESYMVSHLRVDFKILVRRTPERVYEAMTTAKGLDGWFTTNSIVNALAGGSIRFRWKDWGPEKYTGENGGPVLEAVWPSRFVFQWKSDSGLSVTTVEIDFTPVEDGTVVRLQEGGFQDSPEGMRDVLNRSAGWGEALTLMKFFVEHGIRY